MAPPNPDRSIELTPHKRIQEVATLSPKRFKAFIYLINDWISRHEAECEGVPGTPRKWATGYWKEISAKFVADFGDDLWDENRENIRLPKKEEENDEAVGLMDTVENDAAGGGEQNGNTNADGDVPMADPTTPASLAAIPKTSKGPGDCELLDPEDALIFPRDSDTITFVTFNMLRIQVQKHFSFSEQTKRRRVAECKGLIDPMSSSDEEAMANEAEDSKKRKKPGRKPGSAKKIKGEGEATPTPASKKTASVIAKKRKGKEIVAATPTNRPDVVSQTTPSKPPKASKATAPKVAKAKASTPSSTHASEQTTPVPQPERQSTAIDEPSPVPHEDEEEEGANVDAEMKDANESLGDGIDTVSDDDGPGGSINSAVDAPSNEFHPPTVASSHPPPPPKTSKAKSKTSTPAPIKVPKDPNTGPTPPITPTPSVASQKKVVALKDVTLMLYVTVKSSGDGSGRQQPTTLIPLSWVGWEDMKETIRDSLSPDAASAFDDAVHMTVARHDGGAAEQRVKIGGTMKQAMAEKVVTRVLTQMCEDVARSLDDDEEELEVECDVRFE